MAEVLFNDMNVDSYFLEYDDERSGDFEPLRFMPRGKTAVLGIVSSKTGELEDKEVLKRLEHLTPRERKGLKGAVPATWPILIGVVRFVKGRRRHDSRVTM